MLTDEVIDIANLKNLVTFIKFCNAEKWNSEAPFIDSIDLLHFSEIKIADAKTQ